jgi:hypothetical protein
MRFNIVLAPEAARQLYDIEEGRVEVLAIIDKAQAAAWLDEEGEGTEEGGGG